MLVMNGLEATRAIRYSEDRNGIQKRAIIIALTELAGGTDQAEGFASGCDIHLTKPMSFKEMRGLLDNRAAK